MVQAYRLLIQHMQDEFNEIYPLHLGVTEAGDGEDGRIKSAIGIGTLLEDGIGDTIRVSLTEDPEFEIPVCKDLVKRYAERAETAETSNDESKLSYSPYDYKRRESDLVDNVGGKHVPVVIADFMLAEKISHEDLQSIGYKYNALTDKWNIGDAAADFIYSGNKTLDFALPGTLKIICDYGAWATLENDVAGNSIGKYFPLYQSSEFLLSQKNQQK